MDTLDYIINTYGPSVPPSGALPLSLLKVDGKLIMTGVINEPIQFVTPAIMLGRKSIIGTLTGSMEEAQEMLEFCKEKGLTSMIEMVEMDYVNQAMERLERNDVRHRFEYPMPG